MKTIGYGIVGTGYFGAGFVMIIRTLDGAEVVAVYNPESGKTIANEFGCIAEDSLESLRSRPDIDINDMMRPYTNLSKLFLYHVVSEISHRSYGG